jgi:hypothetical protein
MKFEIIDCVETDSKIWRTDTNIFGEIKFNKKPFLAPMFVSLENNHLYYDFVKKQKQVEIEQSTQNIILEILKIPNIKSVFVKPNELLVYKSSFEKWEKISPLITQILERK